MVSLEDFNTIEDALLPWLAERLMINKTFEVQIRAANPILIAPTYVHSIRVDRMYFDHESSGISLYEHWDYGMRYTMRNLRVELTLDIRTHWLWLFAQSQTASVVLDGLSFGLLVHFYAPMWSVPDFIIMSAKSEGVEIDLATISGLTGYEKYVFGQISYAFHHFVKHDVMQKFLDDFAHHYYQEHNGMFLDFGTTWLNVSLLETPNFRYENTTQAGLIMFARLNGTYSYEKNYVYTGPTPASTIDLETEQLEMYGKNRVYFSQTSILSYLSLFSVQSKNYFEFSVPGASLLSLLDAGFVERFGRECELALAVTLNKVGSLDIAHHELFF